MDLSPEENTLLKGIGLITNKKVIYAANVSEDDINTGNDHSKKVQDFAKSQGDEFALISAQIESELASLDTEERLEFLSELGMTESGLGRLATACYSLLNLQSYLTTGPKETRSWTIKIGDTAPQAAGVIHTDFEKGFIRANIVDYKTFIDCGGWKGAKEKGLMRQEGKDYIVQDGDVIEFLFNT